MSPEKHLREGEENKNSGVLMAFHSLVESCVAEAELGHPGALEIPAQRPAFLSCRGHGQPLL